MEANHKKKLFICKFCNKKYPCGKSLGGHIRIHLNGNGNGNGKGNTIGCGNWNSTDVEDKPFAAVNGSNSRRETELFENGAQSGYVLRENPKKTRRFMVDSSKKNLLQDKICKECGKGFQSLKALCGHMACHSKNSFEDHSASETTEKLKNQVMDSQSDTESSSPMRSKRMMRNKTIGVYSSSLASVASDVEQEQEEVAMCLMMLSKDSRFKGCFSSIADSSDNNSVVLETKLSSPELKVSPNNGVNCLYNGNGIEVLEMNKAKQEQILSIEDDHSEDSDSGYFRNGPKKVESDILVHGFTGKKDFRKQKVAFGSRFEDEFDPELGRSLSRLRRIKKELGKDLVDEDFDEHDRVSVKYDSRKKTKNDSYTTEFLGSNGPKTGKCPTVGANRTNHKRTNGCSDSIYESGENSINSDCVPSRKIVKSFNGKKPIEQKLSGYAEKKLVIKKGKVHECPFCFKVFRSGQALGGHKRSHFVGSGEERTLVINQQVPEMSMPGLIDLNLPAPMEEDENGYYIPTW